ncbi:hypothetical protein STENM327S_06364 [Streptomyces tendae]
MQVPALRRAADALLAAAGGGRPHPCDAAFGLRVTEILAEAESMLTRSTCRRAGSPLADPPGGVGAVSPPARSGPNGSSLHRNQARSPSMCSRNSATGPSGDTSRTRRSISA